MALDPDQKKKLLIAGGVGAAALLGVVLFTKPSRANAARPGTAPRTPGAPGTFQPSQDGPSGTSGMQHTQHEKHRRDGGSRERWRDDEGRARGDRDRGDDNERGTYGRSKHRGRHGH